MTSERLDSMNESNGIRALGIVGSPRRGGNTDILVDEVLLGAKKAGALVEKVFLNEVNMAFCQGCETCQQTGECVQQDDMQMIFHKMSQSHVCVIGSPVYYNGPTGQSKVFIDRWYGAKKDTFAGQSVILVVPFAAANASVASHTVGILQSAVGGSKMKLFETLIVPGVWDSGAVRKHVNILAKARRAGRDAIEALD